MPLLPYRGTRVYFDGKHYSVPSLSVLDFEDNFDKLTTTEPITDKTSLKKRFKTLIPVIGIAIRRNYPEITDAFLFEKLDLDTFKECLAAVQANSGMREAGPGEA